MSPYAPIHPPPPGVPAPPPPPSHIHPPPVPRCPQNQYSGGPLHDLVHLQAELRESQDEPVPPNTEATKVHDGAMRLRPRGEGACTNLATCSTGVRHMACWYADNEGFVLALL